MARIGVGGFQHETNTFAPVKADYETFAAPDAWPGLTEGDDIPDVVKGINLPIAGAIDALAELGHEIVPVLWCAAEPSAHVTEDAFERITGMLIDGLKRAGSIDGIYLDLHGAMVTEHLEDGEGELLGRLRSTFGPNLPIAASLDLHANVGPAMVDRADFLSVYRTYPHLDMAQTGARTAANLDHILREGVTLAAALRQLPFLIPLVWQCTDDEPAKRLYANLTAIEGETGADLSLACGFPYADVPDRGPSVIAYGLSRAATEEAADVLAAQVADARSEFTGESWTVIEGVAEGRRRSATAERAVVLADANDNAGTGGTSGTVSILAELIRQEANGAVVGLLCDPAAARTAHAAGEGGRPRLRLGSASLAPNDSIEERSYEVVRLGDGKFPGTGPFYRGTHMELGPMALLRDETGVSVVISTRKQQAADKAMFRHVGVEPIEVPILVLKSSVHYRADFEPIADSLVIIDGPGAAPLDLEKVEFRRPHRALDLAQGRS